MHRLVRVFDWRTCSRVENVVPRLINYCSNASSTGLFAIIFLTLERKVHFSAFLGVQKLLDELTNSVNPNQTSRSGFRLFAQAWLFEYREQNQHKTVESQMLTLTMIWANIADDKLMIFYTNSMEWQIFFFSGKNKKQISKNVVCWTFYPAC